MGTGRWEIRHEIIEQANKYIYLLYPLFLFLDTNPSALKKGINLISTSICKLQQKAWQVHTVQYQEIIGEFYCIRDTTLFNFDRKHGSPWASGLLSSSCFQNVDTVILQDVCRLAHTILALILFAFHMQLLMIGIHLSIPSRVCIKTTSLFDLKVIFILQLD